MRESRRKSDLWESLWERVIYMPCDYDPYALPTIDFVGGETQNLLFNVYSSGGKQPFNLSDCTASFAVVNFTNKTGKPLLTKLMEADNKNTNVLRVRLLPSETMDLFGKYIYQITIKDSDGNVEIPKQGLLYITNNINKSFISL